MKVGREFSHAATFSVILVVWTGPGGGGGGGGGVKCSLQKNSIIAATVLSSTIPLYMYMHVLYIFIMTVLYKHANRSSEGRDNI